MIVQNSMIVFYVLAVPAFFGNVLAGVNRWARLVGRLATGLMMLLGGAGVNASFLISGDDYSGFADDAKFGWVTQAWNAVVPPNYAFFIGLLIAFEAVVGILILSGGRPAQVGLLCAIAFHVALGLFFSWFLTGYAAVMLVALVLLFLAETRPAAAPTARPLRHGLA
ncbi:hypothetical protein [Sinomonas humi]|uniref:DoxX family protein n=1 Tax=Sinomonas humi TaxID=1338436 RepID=A0A0B2APT8_9MICC|nr:hypothetical protein [Sinomonas humi]KHL05678.1 hypothetical protein LK10_00045 [Sinomonas humi]